MINFNSVRGRLFVFQLLIFATVFLIAGCGIIIIRPMIPKGVEPVEVSAAIIQANVALFNRGSQDLPAQVIFTLDPDISSTKLKDLASDISSLKGTVPSDLDKRLMAQAVNNETYYPYDFKKVPFSISGSNDVYIAGVVIDRNKLSRGYLERGVLIKCNLYLIDNGKPHALLHTGEVKGI